MFHHTYKGNPVCFIPAQVFHEGGQEPRKLQRVLLKLLHIWLSICPFTTTFQFIFFWTSCLHPCMAFGDKWCARIWLCPFIYQVTSEFKLEGKKITRPRGLGTKKKKKKRHKKHFFLHTERCLIRTTSLLLCVLRTGLLMSLCAYCMCESQYVGSWGWGKLQDQFHVCACVPICSAPMSVLVCPRAPVCSWTASVLSCAWECIFSWMHACPHLHVHVH